MRNEENVDNIVFSETLTDYANDTFFVSSSGPCTTVIHGINVGIQMPFRIKGSLTYWMKKPLNHSLHKSA